VSTSILPREETALRREVYPKPYTLNPQPLNSIFLTLHPNHPET